MDVPVKCLLVQMPSSPHFPKARHGVSDLRSPVPAWALSRSSGDTQAKGEQGCGEHDPIVKSRLPLCLDTPHREMMGDTTKMRCQPRRDSAGPLVPTPTWLVPTGGFSETRGLLDTGLSPEPASNSREETAGAQDDAAQLPGSREAPSMRQAESLPRAPNSTPPQDAGPGKATPLFISRFPSMASRMRETVLETGRGSAAHVHGVPQPPGPLNLEFLALDAPRFEEVKISNKWTQTPSQHLEVAATRLCGPRCWEPFGGSWTQGMPVGRGTLFILTFHRNDIPSVLMKASALPLKY
ncbi:uncharacterized protein LOC129052743 isoform X5 [Pongo abelii]|uniref:uncharacterized protein LOC129052743 isoform X5 n=1 Tax=Pongo abelii TaxID=9601 RepID=UPI003004BF09